MPFMDMSAARDHEFFCEGMSEEIINALGRVPHLRVASYTSSLRFKGRALDTESIGRDLKVSWLLEGSVRKSGEMVRIAVQLVRASDGFSAWSGRFDRRLDDIFMVQDDIAGMIAQTLTRRVGKAAGPLVTSTTSNTDAYALYLEGRYLWNKRPGDVVWQALDRFERAIAIDPSFAPAHAALAGVYGTLGAWESGLLAPAEALARPRRRQREPSSSIRSWLPDTRPSDIRGCTSTGMRMAPAGISIRRLRSIPTGSMRITGTRMRCVRPADFRVSGRVPHDRRTRSAQSADACARRVASLSGERLCQRAHAG